jgi:hypothetical protein
MKRILFISILIIAVFSSVLGQQSRMGTASSTQLEIVQGAQYLSGGGAVAMATGLDAVFWNPAGLGMSENTVDVIFSNRAYIADINSNYFGVATSLGSLGKVGLTARTLDIGDIKETTVFEADGTGQIFTPNFLTLGLTYARKLSDRTSVGMNINVVSESFGRVAASGLAFDLGVQYKGLFNMDNLNVGFVLKNFGRPMQYDGEGLGVYAEAQDGTRPVEYYKVDAAEADLPFSFDLSAAYSPVPNLTVGGSYTSNYYATDVTKLLVAYEVAGIAALRAGYQMSAAGQDNADDDENSWTYENPFDGVSFGASLMLKQLIGMNLSVDYAFLPAGDFDGNQVIALRMAF